MGSLHTCNGNKIEFRSFIPTLTILAVLTPDPALPLASRYINRLVLVLRSEAMISVASFAITAAALMSLAEVEISRDCKLCVNQSARGDLADDLRLLSHAP